MFHSDSAHNSEVIGEEPEIQESDIPNSLLSVLYDPVMSIQLKQGRIGPSVSFFGTDDLKTLYMIEILIKGRALYTVANQITEKHAGLKHVMINFYTQPTGGFNRKVYLCQITDKIARWAILGNECAAHKSQKFGYSLYVAPFDWNGSHDEPTVGVYVANNKAVGMPFGTRAWTNTEDNICCQGTVRY
jgi:hypothetical protein